MAKDPIFVDSVIDEFADKKDRRIELVYKQIKLIKISVK